MELLGDNKNQIESSAPALHRGLLVLDLIREKTSLSLEQISHHLNLPKSSLTRILDTLEQWSYIKRSSETKRYRACIALIPISVRSNRMQEFIQNQLKSLSTQLNLTTEWFVPRKNHTQMTLRHEAQNSAVHIRAQLGTRRLYCGEFDSLNRIAQSFLNIEPNPEGEYWEYDSNKKEGKKNLSATQIKSRIKAIAGRTLEYDDEYNFHGVRRIVRAVRDHEDHLFGILSVAEYFHPQAKALRKERLAALDQAGNQLEQQLREIYNENR